MSRQSVPVAFPNSTTLGQRRRQLKKPFGRIGKGTIGVFVVVLLWELVRAAGLVDERDLPPVADILRAGIDAVVEGTLLSAIGGTLKAWILGLLAASLLGMIAGVALGLMPRADIATRPILEFIRPIPSVALIPVALIVLGAGFGTEIVLITFAAIWPVLFNVKAGVEGTDVRLLESGRILGLNSRQRIWRIVCPNAVPALATGVRTAAAIALVLAITVEMVTGQAGIGQYLQLVRLSGQVSEMWAAIFVSGVLGYGINVALLALEHGGLKWSAENRER